MTIPRLPLTIVTTALLLGLLSGCTPVNSSEGSAAGDTPGAPSGDAPPGAGASANPASGGTTDPSAAKPVAFQNLTLRWTLKKPDGSPDVCPTNYSKIKVVASAIRGDIVANGDPYTAIYDCAAKTGTIKLQTSGDEPVQKNADGSLVRSPAEDITGRFTVTMAITEPSGETNWLVTNTQLVDLTGADKTLTFDVTPSANYHRTEWRLTAKSTHNDMSCAASGVAQVRVRSKRVWLPDQTPDPSPPTETVETFPCDSEPENVECFGCVGAGTSKPMLFGWYTFSLEALSATGEVVGTVPYKPEDPQLTIDKDSMKLVCAGNACKAYVNLPADTDGALEISNR